MFVSTFLEKLTKCQYHLHTLTGYSSLVSPGDFVPKCRIDNGHYRTLQCDASSSSCFCVDTFDGYELSGSRTASHPDCSKFGMFCFVTRKVNGCWLLLICCMQIPRTGHVNYLLVIPLS